jgi:hypothetical protein
MTGDGGPGPARATAHSASRPYRAAALLLWPRLDRDRLRACRDEPLRIARLVAERTIFADTVIVGMLEKAARAIIVQQGRVAAQRLAPPRKPASHLAGSRSVATRPLALRPSAPRPPAPVPVVVTVWPAGWAGLLGPAPEHPGQGATELAETVTAAAARPPVAV